MTPVLAHGRLLLATLLSLSMPLLAKEWVWQETTGAGTSDLSGFMDAVGVPAAAGEPAKVFLAGNYTGPLEFGGISVGSGQVVSGTYRGMVVGQSEGSGGAWQTDWMAVVSSSVEMEITDVAVAPDTGNVFVCGWFYDDVRFSDSGGSGLNTAMSLNASGGPKAFVGWLDPDTGKWIDTFKRGNISAWHMVAEAGGSVLLSGPGFLAKKLLLDRSLVWETQVSPETSSWSGMATSPDPEDPFIYVLTEEENSNASEDVVLHQLDRATGAVIWTLRMGGPGTPKARGVVVSHDGDVRVSFSVDGGHATIEGDPLDDVQAPAGSEQTILVRVRPNRDVVWATPMGTVDDATSLYFTDLVCDPIGNTWATAVMDGGWSSFDDDYDYDDDGDDDDTFFFTSDGLIMAIDGAGEIFEFQETGGTSAVVPFALAAPDPDKILMAGAYFGNDTQFDNLPEMSDRSWPGAFTALANGVGTQLVRVRPNPAIADPVGLRYIESKLWALGVRAYVDLENGDNGTVASAWLRPEGIATLQANNKLIVEVEADLEVNGVVSDAGWGLARLNDGGTSALPTEVQPYLYPETDDSVILYLVDTAVENTNNWFDANSNLTLESSTLIRGAGDPIVSSQFEHGTRMLSMIAGPETGAAVGTEIRVINYDVYPSGPTTTSALVAKAVIEAVQHHVADLSGDPGVICIASSSESGATSLTLRAAIDLALAEGLVVVVSAGNEGDDVTNYIPASYGSDAGVICVGASDQNNARLAMSNWGSAVDLHAPGQAVRNLRFSNPLSGYYDEMTGTSAATALAAAAAAVEFSNNTSLTPSNVEGALLAGLYDDTVDILQLAPETLIYSDWLALHGISSPDPSADEDGDGMANLLEYFHGCNPTENNCSVSVSGRDPVSGNLELTFPVSLALFDPNDPFVLLDGTAWEVQISCDLVNWTTASGTPTWGTPGAETIPVSFESPQGSNHCFLRIRVMP